MIANGGGPLGQLDVRCCWASPRLRSRPIPSSPRPRSRRRPGSLPERNINGSVDSLRGLKENVIVGRLIPAGTGMEYYRNIQLSQELEEASSPARTAGGGRRGLRGSR